MPNWAIGEVKVVGKPANIEAFCRLFLFKDTEAPNEYFARSFINQNWKDFKKESLGGNNAEFGVEFAWSATSCLIEGYPQDNPKTCLTLIEACKKCKVKVVIDTDECGMGFEEHIECNEEGDLIEKCHDMPTYQCTKCRNEQWITSFCDISKEECCECGNTGKWRFKRN